MSSTSVLSPPSSPAEVLIASPIPQLRRLCVIVNDCEVVISGIVPTYYLKQLAQEALRPVLGLRRLVNQVQVEEV